MSVKRDYYEVLGLSKGADASSIKKAYRKLAKKYHPDTNQGDKQAEKKFKEVTEAYTVLNDPEKKKMYDQFGHAAFDQGASGNPFGAGASGNPFGTGASGDPFSGGSYRRSYTNGNGGYQEYHFESGNMDDMFGDIFGDLFGHGKNEEGAKERFRGFQGYRDFNGYETQRSAKGEDLHAEISVTFEEAVFGCDKTFTLGDPNGQGASKRLQVHIPAGIDTGKSIRLRGKGMPGMNGAENGDLLLKVNVGTKAGYERKGSDVYTTVFVPYTTAVFGGEAKVQTLYGDVLCKIGKGTQSGTKIRLRGKGIASMKKPDVKGDQYVTVQIEVPKYLDPEAERKLREFENACVKSGAQKWKSA